jgi:hypothetical protein
MSFNGYCFLIRSHLNFPQFSNGVKKARKGEGEKTFSKKRLAKKSSLSIEAGEKTSSEKRPAKRLSLSGGRRKDLLQEQVGEKTLL